MVKNNECNWRKFLRWYAPWCGAIVYLAFTIVPAGNLIGKASKPLIKEVLASLYLSGSGVAAAAWYMAVDRILQALPEETENDQCEAEALEEE